MLLGPFVRDTYSVLCSSLTDRMSFPPNLFSNLDDKPELGELLIFGQ
jgi:hypothetical protein